MKYNKYEVSLQDCAVYYGIEAETEEEVIEIALEWWAERKPMYNCEKIEGEE